MFNTVAMVTVDLNADLAEGDRLSPADLGDARLGHQRQPGLRVPRREPRR